MDARERKLCNHIIDFVRVRMVVGGRTMVEQILDQLRRQRKFIEECSYSDYSHRLRGLLEWLGSNKVTKEILDELRSDVDAKGIIERAHHTAPPPVSSQTDAAAVGVLISTQVSEGQDMYSLAISYGIRPGSTTLRKKDYADEIVIRYIHPLLDYFDIKLKKILEDSRAVSAPIEIEASLTELRDDYPDPSQVAFIMMRFSGTKVHTQIAHAVKSTLTDLGMQAVRADDKEYHSDLYWNVITYLFGCGFGIAVFERLEEEAFNPNVGFEVGYMYALQKPVCLLKDKTLRKMQTDLIGKLYRPFDPQDSLGTIPTALRKWLKDKGLVS